MVDPEALKKLVIQSSSLSPEEKKTLDLIIPFMKEEDMGRLFDIFSAEQQILTSMPEITANVKNQLIESFDLSAQMAKNYRENEIKKAEREMRAKEAAGVDDMINKI